MPAQSPFSFEIDTCLKLLGVGVVLLIAEMDFYATLHEQCLRKKIFFLSLRVQLEDGGNKIKRSLTLPLLLQVGGIITLFERSREGWSYPLGKTVCLAALHLDH